MSFFRKIITGCLFILLLFFPAGRPEAKQVWGFFMHKLINRTAVLLLPPELFGFYKHYIRYIGEQAVNPDQRRYVSEDEAPRHYIDLDIYGDSALHILPKYWPEAVEKFGADSLLKHGTGPWNLSLQLYKLTEAFRLEDAAAVLRLSADIGHYAGDMNVPLHTTKNYNGQLTKQYGIHGFWESRIPELFHNQYDMIFPKAKYLERPAGAIWQSVADSHAALDSIFYAEKYFTDKIGDDKKFVNEQRGGQNIRTYSRRFSKSCFDFFAGRHEERFRSSVQLTADLWLTAWINAGQPDMDKFIGKIPADYRSADSLKKAADFRPGRHHEH